MDHEFKTLLAYFSASSMCSELLVKIYVKSIDTIGVQSVYWEEHRLKSQKSWIFILVAIYQPCDLIQVNFEPLFSHLSSYFIVILGRLRYRI